MTTDMLAQPAGSPFAEAVAVLGWDGVLVEDVVLLGSRITVVAAVDRQVHAARQEDGWASVTDYTTLALWEDWPEHQMIPPSAVTLVGFLVRGRRRWRQALGRVGGFAGFGSIAIVMDTSRPPTALCLMNAHYYGIAVLHRTREGCVELAQEGRSGPVSTARRTSISRSVEELVYQEILNRDLVAV